MGSYAEIWLDALYVGSTKNDFDRELMQLFRASDKHEVKGTKNDLPFQIKRNWAEYIEDDDQELNVIYYAAPAKVIKDRLELKRLHAGYG